MFTARREAARQRSATIAAHPSLQERDLLKLDRLGAAVSEALRARGVPGLAAALAAHAGVAAFRVAFDRWLAGSGDDLASYTREAFDVQESLHSARHEPPDSSRSADDAERATAHPYGGLRGRSA